MSPTAMPTFQRPSNGRRSIRPRASFSDDEITPCSSPAPEPQEPIFQPEHQHKILPRFTPSRRGSNSAAYSTRTTSAAQARPFDPTDGEDMDDSQLWQRMLDIQRNFHCYNSARMSAALLELEMGIDVGHLARRFSHRDAPHFGLAAYMLTHP